MKIIKSIDHKRLQSSFYEKLIIFNDISTFLLKKKLFNFYTNIVGTIPLSIFNIRIPIIYSFINPGYKEYAISIQP